MHKRQLLLFIFSLLSFIIAIGQHEPIPNVPNEIRILPDNFKEDYQSDEYNYTESVSLITKFKIWLLEKLKGLFDVNDANAYETLTGLKYIFYFLVIGLAVYLLVKMILGKEGRWLFGRNKSNDSDPDFTIDEDIQSVNFTELIAKAEATGDFRLAIKYHYFHLLKKLDDTTIIKYDSQKTTYDYQLELEGTKYSTIFSKAAYYYTYIWYGEFSIDTNEYQTTSNVFTQLLKSTRDE